MSVREREMRPRFRRGSTVLIGRVSDERLREWVARAETLDRPQRIAVHFTEIGSMAAELLALRLADEQS